MTSGWTVGHVLLLISEGNLPTDFIKATARFLKDKPHLWLVSDEQFLAAVQQVNPDIAAVLRSDGATLMHRTSNAVMARVLQLRMGMKDE